MSGRMVYEIWRDDPVFVLLWTWLVRFTVDKEQLPKKETCIGTCSDVLTTPCYGEGYVVWGMGSRSWGSLCDVLFHLPCDRFGYWASKEPSNTFRTWYILRVYLVCDLWPVVSSLFLYSPFLRFRGPLRSFCCDASVVMLFVPCNNNSRCHHAVLGIRGLVLVRPRLYSYPSRIQTWCNPPTMIYSWLTRDT